MLAFLFSILSVFSLEGNSHFQENYPLGDTLKQHKRKAEFSDSTGRFVRINRVFIIGNRITRDQIILRELTLKTGDYIYNLDLVAILQQDQKKLINTRLFNTVDIRTLELDAGVVDLLIDVNERWYTFPTPIFELSDRNFNEWWQTYNHDFSRVNYGLRLYQYNMRGRNETLRFHGQLGFARRFNISYRFPYIDKKQHHGLAIDFDFAETKNLAIKTENHKLTFLEDDKIIRTSRGGGLAYIFRPSFYISHTFRTEYKSVTIADTVAKLNPNYLGPDQTQQQYSTISYQFVADRRDYVGYPLTGYYITGYIVRDGVLENDDVSKLEIGGSATKYIDLKKGFYLSNNTSAIWSSQDDLPYNRYSAMGYQKQFVRGYEVYVIEGYQYLLNKTTLKKRIFSRTYHWGAMPIQQFRHIPFSVYLKVYGDLGYVSNYNNYTISNTLTDRLLSSVGFGMDLVGSYDAVIRLEYTFNEEGDRGFFFHLKKEF